MELARLRPTWAEINLDHIGHNITELRRLAPGAQLMAVVKADGYGHGAVPVARAALEAGAAWLAVATLEEGVDLRKAGLTVPILVLGYIPPIQADTVVLYDLHPSLFHLDLAQALAQWGRALMRQVPVHVKVDTGMGRIGVSPSGLADFVKAVKALPQIELEGVFTHLATADEPGNDYTATQIARFRAALGALADAGYTPKYRHTCNSAGIMLHPAGHFDLVRAGIAMYGLAPDPGVQWPADLRPALTWKTRVGMIKTVESGTAISYGCTYRAEQRERVASLPIGYADGYFRLNSNRSEVLIGGRRCPVVGRVCMDQTMVRVPEDLDVKVGDEVVLLGEQGDARITAGDLAAAASTINYEVVCAISKRVPRVYVKDGERQK